MQQCIMLNWSDFEVILAIHENLTLSAAARRLGVNQSTVSRTLMRIEQECGTPIFANLSGTYQVTHAGENYFRVAKEMQKSVLSQAGSLQYSPVRGTIRLTTVEALVRYILSRIRSFTAEFPEISIELHGSNQNAHLPRRQFQAALRLHREENSKSLLVKKVGEIGISGYQSRKAKSSDSWIGYESSLDSIPEQKWLNVKLKKRQQILKVSSYVTMENAIEHGLGQGLLPHFMGDHNPELRRITGSNSILMRPIWFVSHAESRREPAMNLFAKWLFSQLDKDRDFLK